MNKKKYFRLLSFALLITSSLMIVANNVPYLGSFRFFWEPLGLLSFIFFYPKVILNKMVINILLYGFLFTGILQYTLWNFASDWYKHSILEDFYNLVIFVFLAAYLLTAREFVFWGRLSKWGLYFLIITAIFTLVALQIAPTIIRESYSIDSNDIQGYSTLFKLGFGGYGFGISLVALIPVLVFFIKSESKIFFSKKALWILLSLVLITLVQMQIFANIIVATFLIIFSFISSKNRIKGFFLNILLALILSLIPSSNYVKVLTNFSSNFSIDSDIYYKLNDMANYIDKSNESKNGIETRSARYPELFNAFSAKPIFGDASYASYFQKELQNGGHLFWMSRLTLWGIIGFIFYLLILKNIFKPIHNLFDKEFRYYYGLSLFSVVVLGLIKNLAGREPYLMLLIIIPGLYFYSKSKLERNKRQYLKR